MSAMAASHATGTSVERRRRPRVGAAWAAIAALDLAVVALLVLVDRVEVTTATGLGHVVFGAPLSWVMQDQAGDPSFPYVASLGSPWEDPSTIAWLPLVVDLVVVGLVLAGVWRALLALRSGRPAS